MGLWSWYKTPYKSTYLFRVGNWRNWALRPQAKEDICFTFSPTSWPTFSQIDNLCGDGSKTLLHFHYSAQYIILSSFLEIYLCKRNQSHWKSMPYTLRLNITYSCLWVAWIGMLTWFLCPISPPPQKKYTDYPILCVWYLFPKHMFFCQNSKLVRVDIFTK